MKIKKKQLKALLERCERYDGEDDWEITLWREASTPEVIRALVKEVLKGRKRAKRFRPLLAECEEFRQDVRVGFTEDGVAQRYANIGDLAAKAVLGVEFVERINKLP